MTDKVFVPHKSECRQRGTKCKFTISTSSPSPTLTWRDVQYLIAYTSNPDLLPEGDWATNGAGLNVSHKHGFGVMDAEAMVIRARLWMTVPEQQSYSISPGYSCK